MLVIVDVAVSKLVAVMVLVAIPIRVLRAESASTDCAVAASNTAINWNFMIQRMTDENEPWWESNQMTEKEKQMKDRVFAKHCK